MLLLGRIDTQKSLYSKPFICNFQGQEVIHQYVYGKVRNYHQLFTPIICQATVGAYLLKRIAMFVNIRNICSHSFRANMCVSGPSPPLLPQHIRLTPRSLLSKLCQFLPHPAAPLNWFMGSGDPIES